ncbi:GIY-YIG nuclease family protein [uncultured Ferrimonas sp.]|uniref:GIY-YIG nuclease family protein n=1 Tax=uncultured Ferrimonas sp. TaxID=432640 RepID=UPI0026231917|nr:GIY-YIG nuclease family protein [uncultured Ferrimonas sp.]
MFQYQGKSYKSLNALYSAYKDQCAVSAPSFKARLDGGWSIEKSLSTPKGFMPGKPVYHFNGVDYPSISGLYKANKAHAKVSLPLFTERVEAGMSIDEAMVAPKKKTGTSSIATEHDPLIVEGKQYDCLKDVAVAYGVKYNTMIGRYRRGRRGDDLVILKAEDKAAEAAASAPAESTAKAAPFMVVDGVEYASENDLCNAFKVNRSTYRARLKRGLTVAQALGQAEVADGRRSAAGVQRYDFQGASRSVQEIAELTGMSASTLRDRLCRGATLEQALSNQRFGRGVLGERQRAKTAIKRRSVTVDGVTYSSIKDLAEAYQLPYYVVQQRISTHGWTPEQAVTEEGRSRSITVGGTLFSTIKDAAAHHGLDVAVVRARMNNDWSIEQTFGLVPAPHVHMYQGQSYSSLAALSEVTGISVHRLSNRLRSGLSIDQAVALGNERIVGPGRYNETILKRDPALANTPALLYFVSLPLNGELKYKIGITTKTVRERLSGESPNFQQLAVRADTLMACYLMEQQLHQMLESENDKSIDSTMLDGYTEIFDLDDAAVNTVIELINEV